MLRHSLTGKGHFGKVAACSGLAITGRAFLGTTGACPGTAFTGTASLRASATSPDLPEAEGLTATGRFMAKKTFFARKISFPV